MVNLIINLLLIQIITVFIVDLSGVMDTLKKWIWKKWIKVGKWYNLSLKPFDCSLCSTWWLCLIYLFCTNQITLLTVAIAAIIAFLASVAGDFLVWVKECLTAFINLLYKPFGK